MAIVDAVRGLGFGPRGPHGPLPLMLMGLTVVTGLVDAFSYLQLRHVLVANMTGNFVFLGFAVGSAPGFVWWALLLAIAVFLAGAFAGGRLRALLGSHRGRHLHRAVAVEFVVVTAACVLAAVQSAPYRDAAMAGLIMLLGFGLGVQNATARALAVPDLTTTVLTLTLTGIAADSKPAGGGDSKVLRRAVPIGCMFLGAFGGAMLCSHGHGPAALGVAAGVLAVILVAGLPATREQPAWAAPV